MNTQALQELVKRIFGDEDTRREFLKNPDSVLSRFTLSEQEKQAALNMHARLGLVTSGSTQLETVLGPMEFWSAPVPKSP